VKRAVALQYDDGCDDAPVVVSAGEGDLAERIERAARDYGVAVVRDVPLAEALSVLHVGDPIPEALYESVAAILSEIASEGSPIAPRHSTDLGDCQCL
jgi:type III secretion system FlhB-like substrate exporter